MKTLVYSIHGFDKPYIEKANSDKMELDYTTKSLNSKTATLATGYDAVALFASDEADSQVLNQLHKVGIKFIALRSAGYNNVDLIEAKKLGIKVGNVPEYSPYAIAEHSVAMLLMLIRKLSLAQEQFTKNDFRLDNLIGFDIHGKTVGIIGTGKIGIAFARIMKGFGCNLLGNDIVKNPEAENLDLEYTTLDHLLRESDIVSLHCPLNPKTHYLLDKNEFDKIKNSAILINTSRGSVINTAALIESLENKKIGGACLDVYENEKDLFFHDHRKKEITDKMFSKLRSIDKVLLTGHQAFLTNEALEGIANSTIANLHNWSTRGYSLNDLN